MPSWGKIGYRCALTVRCDTSSRAAISRLLRPAAASFATCVSWAVSAAAALGSRRAAGLGARGRRGGAQLRRGPVGQADGAEELERGERLGQVPPGPGDLPVPAQP